MKTFYQSKTIPICVLVLLALAFSPALQANPANNNSKGSWFKAFFQKSQDAPVVAPDLSDVLDMLSKDITQPQDIEVKSYIKFSTTKIKPLKTMVFNIKATNDKGLTPAPVNGEKSFVKFDDKFNGMVKLFLSNKLFFNSVFNATELKIKKNANALITRKLLLTPNTEFLESFGIKKIIASLDAQGHLRAVEIVGKGSRKIYEFTRK